MTGKPTHSTQKNKINTRYDRTYVKMKDLALVRKAYKMLSYRRETALQGAL